MTTIKHTQRHANEMTHIITYTSNDIHTKLYTHVMIHTNDTHTRALTHMQGHTYTECYIGNFLEKIGNVLELRGTGVQCTISDINLYISKLTLI